MHPSAAASKPSPKPAVRGVEKQIPRPVRAPPLSPPPRAPPPRPEVGSESLPRGAETPSSSAPLRHRLQVRPEFGGGSRWRRGAEKKTPSPAARPSAIASGPFSKAASRDAEKQTFRPGARPSATASEPGPNFDQR